MVRRAFVTLLITNILGMLVTLFLFITFSDYTINFFYVLLTSPLLAFLLLIFLFVLNFLAAGILARGISNVINNIDIDEPFDIYDELNEFFQKLLTRRRQIENQMEELRFHTKTSKALIENMQDGFVMVDSFTTVISANPRALELFDADHNPEEKNIICLLADSVFLEKVDDAIKGIGSLMVLNKHERVVQLSFLPSANKGAIILATDITKEEQAEKMRKEFSANVSHELKTPLTIIGGFAELIMEGMVNPDDIVNFAKKINTESNRMVQLIDSILLLSKLDEQGSIDALSPFDIAEIATEAIENLSPLAEKQGIEVSFTSTPCVMNCNRLLVYEMLVNLIDNAIQYNIIDGKVEVVVKEHVKSDGTKFCLISVSDTGVGIPAEEQSRVFERFYRVEQSRCRKTGGAGLGLSIVNHIVRYHRGTIELDSEEGKGLRIDISLPIVS